MKYSAGLLAALAALAIYAIYANFASGARPDIGAYAEQCAADIGEIREFSCDDGKIVPVTQNGKIPNRYTKNMKCDHPGLLPNVIGDKREPGDGQCVPHSRILNLSTESMQVSVMCRQKRIRAADSMDFDEIDVIAHNPATGATCWFQAMRADGSPTDGSSVPSPTSATNDSFWRTPQHVLSEDCGGCHDNDPFMYSPFVGQVWAHVPVNAFGPYYHVDLPGEPIGFSGWPTEALALRDSTCMGCHRIGKQTTCLQLTRQMTGRARVPGADDRARSYPGSHSMPPHEDLTETAWDNIYGKAVDDIVKCCIQAESCQWSQIPAHKSGPSGQYSR